MTEGSHDKKGRVLIIDDEPDMICVVKAGLERKGFEVDSYIDPILAWQNFKSGSYQLSILSRFDCDKIQLHKHACTWHCGAHNRGKNRSTLIWLQ
jgi:DNA-binding response OmpR family regulator